jgi:hypothetical protein
MFISGPIKSNNKSPLQLKRMNPKFRYKNIVTKYVRPYVYLKCNEAIKMKINTTTIFENSICLFYYNSKPICALRGAFLLKNKTKRNVESNYNTFERRCGPLPVILLLRPISYFYFYYFLSSMYSSF